MIWWWFNGLASIITDVWCWMTIIYMVRLMIMISPFSSLVFLAMAQCCFTRLRTVFEAEVQRNKRKCEGTHARLAGLIRHNIIHIRSKRDYVGLLRVKQEISIKMPRNIKFTSARIIVLLFVRLVVGFSKAFLDLILWNNLDRVIIEQQPLLLPLGNGHIVPRADAFACVNDYSSQFIAPEKTRVLSSWCGNK